MTPMPAKIRALLELLAHRATEEEIEGGGGERTIDDAFAAASDLDHATTAARELLAAWPNREPPEQAWTDAAPSEPPQARRHRERFICTWELPVDAASARDAAVMARGIHADPESVATVFRILDQNKQREYVIDAGDAEHPTPRLLSTRRAFAAQA